MRRKTVRLIAGLLLFAAAVLRANQLLNEPTATIVQPTGSLLSAVQVAAELVIGLLVLSGAYWRALRWFTVVLFAGFAIYSVYLALKGAGSCGCFGPVHVHPWATFILDLAMVAGLIMAALRDRNSFLASTNESETRAAWFWIDRRKLIAAVSALGVVTVAFFIRSVERPTAVANGITATASGLVLLEPEKWIGQKLPIAEFVDTDLSNGDWIAVLHRHDCPACEEAVPRYEQLAATGQRIALIEIPPFGYSRTSGSSTCRYSRLTNDREWFVQTPVEIRIENGIVTTVKTHGE